METGDKFLSLPPHVSVSWKNVRSLHMEGPDLVVTLVDGRSIVVPKPEGQVVENVFAAHAKFLNTPLGGDIRLPPPGKIPFPEILEGGGQMPFRLGIGGMDGFQQALQHNPEQAHMKDLPRELTDKIAAISKVIVPGGDMNSIPKGEPHCNCMYCQIARAIERGLTGKEPEEVVEEEVTNEDLRFRDWNIVSCGENMYMVTNPLNHLEEYRVFLGTPVGCTCGQKDCEHLLAVLRS